jgi:hypothetical protein
MIDDGTSSLGDVPEDFSRLAGIVRCPRITGSKHGFQGAQMQIAKFFSVAVVLASLACQSTTEPSPIPIQFQSAFGVQTFQPLAISVESARIRVVGGYQGTSCGAIGAFGEGDGSVLRLTVGPRATDAPCDAALVNYSYTAILDVPGGTYNVEVFHRRASYLSVELAGQAVVTVQRD